MTGFELVTGVTVHIKFTHENTATSAPTLNINNKGAKPIVQYGTTAAGTAEETSGWQAGAVLTLTYDGTSWVRDQGYNTNSFTNTTYTFANGTNGFTVTPSGGSAQTVTVTPSITDNITGSGTSGKLVKFNGTNTITDGPALSSAISSQSQSTKFLREDGTWAAPSYTTNTDNDTKVTQTGVTDNQQLSILLKNTNNTTDETNEVKYGKTTNKLVTVNPSTGRITAPGGLEGKADSAGNADTVNNHTVAADVPANAVFTDTTSINITANATDGMWNITGTSGTNEVTYELEPYNSKSEGKFYTHTDNPSHNSTSLKFDGQFYATKLYSGSNEVLTSHANSYGNAVPANTNTNESLTTNSTAIAAESNSDTLQFTGANKWINLASSSSNTNNEIKIAHALNGMTFSNDATTKDSNPNSPQTPGYNQSFNIPLITIDKAGHVTNLDTTTVTLPDEVHLEAGIFATDSTGTDNITSATSNPYLAIVETDGTTDTRRNAVQLNAGSNMSISANNGVVTFAATDTTYSTFGASGSTHAPGLVPDPSSTQGDNKFLCEDATWKTVTDTHLRLHKKTVNSNTSVPLVAAIDDDGLDAPTFANSATYEDIHGVIPNSDAPTVNLYDGTITATGFSGAGANLTALNMNNVSNGILTIAHGGIGTTVSNTNTTDVAPHYVLAGPSTGSSDATPTWREIIAADLPEGSRTAKGILQLGISETNDAIATNEAGKAANAKSVYALKQIVDSLAVTGTVVFQNVINSESNLPSSGYSQGYMYMVGTAGQYIGQACEVGDFIIAIENAAANQSAINNSHWAVIQNNVVGPIFKGSNTLADGHVLLTNGTNGQVIDSNIVLTNSASTTVTLTLNDDYTLAAACEKNVTDATLATAIPNGNDNGGPNVITARAVYYGLPNINNVHTYNSNDSIYAPTDGGGTGNNTAGKPLISVDNSHAPVWYNGLILSSGTSNNAPIYYAKFLDQVGIGTEYDDARTTNSHACLVVNLAKTVIFSNDDGSSYSNIFIMDYDGQNNEGRFYPGINPPTGLTATVASVLLGTTDNRWKAGYFSDELNISSATPTITLDTTATSAFTWSISNSSGDFAIINDATVEHPENQRSFSYSSGLDTWNLRNNLIINGNLENKGYIFHKNNNNYTNPMLWLDSTITTTILYVSSGANSYDKTHGYALKYYGNTTVTVDNEPVTNTKFGDLDLIADNYVTNDGADVIVINITQSGAVTLGNTLTVTGATALGSTLNVTGASTLTGALAVNNDVTINYSSGTNNGTLTVAGATSLGSTLGVTGATTLSSTLGVADDTTINTLLYINGTIPSSNPYTLYVGGTTNITGAVTLDSTLDASGDITVSRTNNNPGIWVENTTTGSKVGLYSADTNGNHGIYSTGYYDSANDVYETDGRWLIYRDSNNRTNTSWLTTNKLYLVSTVTDLTDSANGTGDNNNSAIHHEILGEDKDGKSWFCVEGTANTDGTVQAWLGVRNYDTNGTAQSWKGITINEAKDDTLTYTVSDASAFRSAISVIESESGTASTLAYYSTANKISSLTHVGIMENMLFSSSRNNTDVNIYGNGLIIWGQTYGNTATDMLSNTAGIFRFGDGGPQIIFNTTNSLNAQAGALIFTDHDYAANGASFHFVTTESNDNTGGNLTVTAPRFRARKGLTVGQNSDNTSYALYVNGLAAITNNSNTVTIGSQNSSWCHFNNSANISFYFNHAVHAVDGFTVYNTATSLTSNYLKFGQGGGWYMSDSSWIRSYGSKSVYVNTGELRCDGATWGGKVKLTSDYMGIYSSNGGGTRYGFLEITSTKYYFRKENGADTYPFDFNGGIYATGKLHITNNEDVGLNQNGAFVIGSKSGLNLAFDDNEFMARNNSAASTLYINSEGGLVYIGSGGLQVTGRIKVQKYIDSADNTLELHNNAGYYLSLQNDGNLVWYNPAGTRRWSSGTPSSSQLVKYNITPLEEQEIENLKKLNVIRFDYKPEMLEGDTTRRYGMIAEEVLPLFPDIVDVPENYNPDQFDITKGPNQPILGIHYDRFIPILIKAVQMQDKEIKQLKSEIQSLKNGRR